MSLFSIFFGCKQDSKTNEKQQEEWPQFPASDNAGVKIEAINTGDNFWPASFFITEDKQFIYLLGMRASDQPKTEEEGAEPTRNRSDVVYTDYRLYCLDSKGGILYHKDMLRTKWSDVGTFGLLEGQLMLRIGDCFLVLNPKTFAILEKIPVHESRYISWENEVMTPDEFELDYQKKFDKLYKNPEARWLEWAPVPEYLVFVQGPAGKRTAWPPMSYEPELLSDLKKRFKTIALTANPNTTISNAEVNLEITDSSSKIREAEVLSAGTEFSYPNYLNRSIVQYEMMLGNQTLHFSTTNKKRHDLRLCFADNYYLTTLDGTAWIKYEGMLYRVFAG